MVFKPVSNKKQLNVTFELTNADRLSYFEHDNRFSIFGDEGG